MVNWFIYIFFVFFSFFLWILLLNASLSSWDKSCSVDKLPSDNNFSIFCLNSSASSSWVFPFSKKDQRGTVAQCHRHRTWWVACFPVGSGLGRHMRAVFTNMGFKFRWKTLLFCFSQNCVWNCFSPGEMTVKLIMPSGDTNTKHKFAWPSIQEF